MLLGWQQIVRVSKASIKKIGVFQMGKWDKDLLLRVVAAPTLIKHPQMKIRMLHQVLVKVQILRNQTVSSSGFRGIMV